MSIRRLTDEEKRELGFGLSAPESQPRELTDEERQQAQETARHHGEMERRSNEAQREVEHNLRERLRYLRERERQQRREQARRTTREREQSMFHGVLNTPIQNEQRHGVLGHGVLFDEVDMEQLNPEESPLLQMMNNLRENAEQQTGASRTATGVRAIAEENRQRQQRDHLQDVFRYMGARMGVENSINEVIRALSVDCTEEEMDRIMGYLQGIRTQELNRIRQLLPNNLYRHLMIRGAGRNGNNVPVHNFSLQQDLQRNIPVEWSEIAGRWDEVNDKSQKRSNAMNITIGENNKIYVKIPADDIKTKNEVKRVGARYNGEQRAYILTRQQIDFIRIASLKDTILRLHEKVLSLRPVQVMTMPTEHNNILRMIQRYNFKLKPRKHQYDALAMSLKNKKYALLMEMGTGKTKVAIDFCEILRNNNLIHKPILAVVPNSVIFNWKNEVFKNTHRRIVAILTGTKKERIKDLRDGLERNVRYFIINYEGVLVLRTELENKFDVVICDESSRIKNPRAKTTRIITEIFKEQDYKLILSGTPITQNPIDIYSQYNFLNPNYLGFRSWFTFRNRYCEMGGYGGYEIIAYKHLDELKEKINKYGYIIKKDECLDLPDKIYQVRQLTMSPGMREQYNQMKKEFIIELNSMEKVTASIILTKLLRLSEITAGNYLDTEETKIKELQSVIEEGMSDKKIVIWARFIKSIEKIVAKLTQINIPHVAIWGAIPAKKRQAMIDRFNNEPSCKVFIGQIQSMGMGINLTSANMVIYYENTYSLQDRLQSEDRVHRMGQKNSVVYVDLVYEDSIDVDVLNAIKSKKSIADYLVEGVRSG